MQKSIIVLLLAFFFVACGSDESNDPNPQTQVDAPDTREEIEGILASQNSRKWMVDEFRLAGMSLDCRQDDSFEFFADGSFKFNGGDQLCGLEDILREREGTWNVLVDENKVMFELSTGEKYEALYEKVTEEQLRFRGSWGGMSIVGVFSPSNS